LTTRDASIIMGGMAKDTVRTPVPLSELDATQKVIRTLLKLPDDASRKRVALAAAAAAGVEVAPIQRGHA
jgi:hypothetical protein